MELPGYLDHVTGVEALKTIFFIGCGNGPFDSIHTHRKAMQHLQASAAQFNEVLVIYKYIITKNLGLS